MYSRLELQDLSAFPERLSADEAFADVADGGFFASLDHPVSFYLVRHGRSEGNASMTFQGRLDYPLDAMGLRQAEAAAAWLSGFKADCVLTSPLKRAFDTAAIIAAAQGKLPQILPSLIEVDVGIFSGMPAGRAKAEEAEIFRTFEYSSWDAVPGAENSERMYYRAMASWRKMRDIASGGARNIVCVSHGGTMQWLLRTTFGARTWLPLFPTANCGISQYDVEPTGAGQGAFVQWSRINFAAPGVEPGTKPVF
jgi:broad specificity phosphatase PhoE